MALDRSYPNFGALVVSLDFELHWGVRDKEAVSGPYEANLRGVWEAVPRILDTFQEFGVAATWATVGLLFADSRDQMERHVPRVKPGYLDKALYPYDEGIGLSEDDDPLHYAPSLIESIRQCSRQEIGTHTFSHYYCLEPGQNKSSFVSDLQSAISMAREKDIELRSIVFPRNQYNQEYREALYQNGIVCYRGNQRAWMYRAADEVHNRRVLKRLGRLVDTYFNLAGYHTVGWDEIFDESTTLCNVPASFYIRPFAPRFNRFDVLRLRRIEQSMRRAAEEQEIVHIWWHPHDFGIHTDENIAFLRKILSIYRELRRTHGMKSLTMSEVADHARAVRVDPLNAISS